MKKIVNSSSGIRVMGFHREGISGRWSGYMNSLVAPLLTPSGMSAICISGVQSKSGFGWSVQFWPLYNHFVDFVEAYVRKLVYIH